MRTVHRSSAAARMRPAASVAQPHRCKRRARALMGIKVKATRASPVASHANGLKWRLATMAANLAGQERQCRKSPPPTAKHPHRHPCGPSPNRQVVGQALHQTLVGCSPANSGKVRKTMCKRSKAKCNSSCGASRRYRVRERRASAWRKRGSPMCNASAIALMMNPTQFRAPRATEQCLFPFPRFHESAQRIALHSTSGWLSLTSRLPSLRLLLFALRGSWLRRACAGRVPPTTWGPDLGGQIRNGDNFFVQSLFPGSPRPLGSHRSSPLFEPFLIPESRRTSLPCATRMGFEIQAASARAKLTPTPRRGRARRSWGNIDGHIPGPHVDEASYGAGGCPASWPGPWKKGNSRCCFLEDLEKNNTSSWGPSRFSKPWSSCEPSRFVGVILKQGPC